MAPSAAAVFVKEMVRLHEIPLSIIFDRDKVFLSKFWCELFHLQGTKLKFSSAYHPQTDGQTEVINRGVESYLRCFSSVRPKKWYRFLPWAEFSYNTSFHVAAQCTPFHIVYGRDPPPLMRFEKGTTDVSSLDQQLAERDKLFEELKIHLNRAQQQMKTVADKHRRAVELTAGDMVYLKMRPYQRRSLAHRPSEKLAPRYYGPFKVVAKFGKVAYHLELSPTDSSSVSCLATMKSDRGTSIGLSFTSQSWHRLRVNVGA